MSFFSVTYLHRQVPDQVSNAVRVQMFKHCSQVLSVRLLVTVNGFPTE